MTQYYGCLWPYNFCTHMGCWIQAQGNKHTSTPQQSPNLRRKSGAARSYKLSLAQAVLQKQPQGRLRALLLLPVGGDSKAPGPSKHPAASLLAQTEVQVYSLSLFPILRGFSWLKEIYNQDDNSQDSTNPWRQNYWARARKGLLELPQTLIFSLNNSAKQ